MTWLRGRFRSLWPPTVTLGQPDPVAARRREAVYRQMLTQWPPPWDEDAREGTDPAANDLLDEDQEQWWLVTTDHNATEHTEST